ncbi:FeoC-like transcriptional regulator [Actinophytocola sp.]|uniref:FeoC-like transcriptional regulator n=1 Tax=Actinophytocola sp. TaxID=1872138 RepID=UPI00345C38DA
MLAEIRAARPGTRLDDIARHLDLTRDELDAMIGYWVHRGQLTVAEIGGCPPVGCAGCFLAHAGRPGCGRSRPGRSLVAIAAPAGDLLVPSNPDLHGASSGGSGSSDRLPAGGTVLNGSTDRTSRAESP